MRQRKKRSRFEQSVKKGIWQLSKDLSDVKQTVAELPDRMTKRRHSLETTASTKEVDLLVDVKDIARFVELMKVQQG